MKLREVLDYLANSTLQSLYVGRGMYGNEIPDVHKKLVYSHINVALRNLHARFPLLMRDTVLILRENIAIYYLRSEYAKCNKNSTVKMSSRYIDDTIIEPFTDDIVRIEEITNKDGRIIYVNNLAMDGDIRVVNDTTIQVPSPKNGEQLFISYSAYPEKITENVDPDTFDININILYLEALTAYVGFKEYSSMAAPGASAKGQEYFLQYNMECEKLLTYNVNNISATTDTTIFEKRGFI